MKRIIFSVLGAAVVGAMAIGAVSVKEENTPLPPVTPPFLEDFSDGVEALDRMTVIDANNDGKTWTVMGMQARIQYNNKLDMDDWMITRGLNLEAGKAYEFSIVGCNSNATSYVEEFEVKLGKANTVEAMTQTVLPVTKVNSKSDMYFSSYFYVSESGVYYLGVHGCSPKNKRTLYLDDIKISGALDGNLPQSVTEATATPAADGSYKAEIKFKAPTKNLLDKDLTSLTKIDILGGNSEVVKSFTNPAPGAELTYEGVAETSGNQSWTIVPYTVAGKGPETTVSAYVGFGKPQPVSNLKIEETSTPGEVKISWDAPEKDLNGLSLPASALTYKIQDVGGNSPVVLDAEFKGTSYIYKAVEEGTQAFKAYQINAITEGGISSAVISSNVAVGTPYPLIYRESFEDHAMSHIHSFERVTGAGSWSIFSSSAHPAQDNDGGLVGMTASNLRDAARLVSGKIDLSGATSPKLMFYTWNFNSTGDNVNEIKVEVLTPDAAAVILNKTVNDLSSQPDAWNKVEVSLAEFKDKTIQIGITATAMKYVYTLVDAISVLDDVENNLSLISLDLPLKVKTNEPFEIGAIIRNNGSLKADGHEVELYRNGVKINTIKGSEIKSEMADTISLRDSLTVLDPVDLTYAVKVKYDADQHPEDNMSEEIKVTHKLPSMPMPTDLKGTPDAEGKPEISWTAPETSGVSLDPITDDMESYTSWANKAVGDWLFLDIDKGTIGGSGSNVFPGIDRGSQQSFYVMDSTLEGLNASYAAHSGIKCFANMFITSGDKKVDDWLISPELSGDAQTITFWAKSYQQSNAETIEILYSKTGRQTTDFTLIETKENLVFPWTEYSFSVPEGAKYFAIRCISVDKYMLMLDDFTYIPAGFAQLDLTGYNLYRDGVKINDEPLTSTSFVDKEAAEGAHSYRVSAVYKQGESAATAEIMVNSIPSSINDVNADMISVVGAEGKIILTGVYGNVTVSDTKGVVIYNGTIDGSARINADKGIYIVRYGKKAYRVNVR